MRCVLKLHCAALYYNLTACNSMAKVKPLQ